jgi:hypothetical protein
MRRLLGPVLPILPVLLLAGVLAACDDDSGGVARDPAPTSQTSPTSPTSPTSQPSETSHTTSSSDAPTDGTVDFELVTTLTETEAGGKVSQVAVPLAAGDDVQAFTAQFETDAMKARVQDEVQKTDVPDGMLLYGAVVAIGCDAPTAVNVSVDSAGVVVTAEKVPSPLQECFAPMTTVALVLVPASAVS